MKIRTRSASCFGLVVLAMLSLQGAFGAEALNPADPHTYLGKFWRVHSQKFGGGIVLFHKGWDAGVALNNNCSENRCLWLLAPGSSPGYVYLLNRGSGDVLCVKDGATGNNTSGSKGDWQVGYHPEAAVKHPAWCEWKIEPIDANYYRIRNLNSNRCITVRDCKYTFLSHWDCTAACNEFALSFDSQVPVPRLADADAEAPDIVRLNGYEDLRRLPEQGKAVVVGEALLPYIAVADSERPQSWKINNSPYYVISRKQVYVLEQADDVGEGISEKLTITVTEGASASSTETSEKTTGWRITAKASFEFKGFSAGLEREINEQLKLTKSTSKTEYREKKIQRELDTPASRIAYAIWTLVNQYELRRSDGSVAARWDVYTDRHIVDSYPKERLKVTFD